MRMRVQVPVGLALVLIASSNASGQSAGVKGGWARSTIAGQAAGASNGINHVAGGAFVDVPVGSRVSVQAEVLYLPKGDAYRTSGFRSAVIHRYIEVPILAKMVIPIAGSPVMPDVFAGPFVGVSAACTVETSGSVDSSGRCLVPEVAGRTDMGLALGAGLRFPSTAGVAGLIEARYDLGLRAINSTPISDFMNRSFVLFAGVAVPIGSRGEGRHRRAR